MNLLCAVVAVVVTASLTSRVDAFLVQPPPGRNQQQRQQQRKSRQPIHFAVNGDPPPASTSDTTRDITDTTTTASTTTTTTTLADRVRPDFDILHRTVSDQPLIYLDSGATSQKPRQVVEAVDDYYQRYNSNVHRGAHTLSREATAGYEAARDKAAQWMGARSRDEVIFTSGATEAINLIVQTYGRQNLRATDEVVLTVAEHHANLVPWQILAQEIGFTLRFVRVDPETGELDLEHFASLLNDRTRMVGFQHVSNVLGFINPVETMVQLIRDTAPHAKIVLDACQSIPHMRVNVQELGVDFVAASGHKMCAPTGIGLLWGKLDLLNSMPPYQGGGEMIDQVTLQGSTWLPSPARFEAGTPPIAQAVGLGAAMDYMESIGGIDAIEAYEHGLGEYLYEQLSAVPGISVLGPKTNRAPLAAFTHESVHPSDLSSFLDMEGVAVRAGHHCCQPLHTELGISHSVRASLSFYNTRAEIDAFIGHLKETLQFFDNLEQGGDKDDDTTNSDEDDFVPFV